MGDYVNIQDTSLEAFEEVKQTLGERQQIVFGEIRLKKGITNAMISRNLQIPINSITPRTNELVKKHLVEEAYRDKCPVTGRKAIFWTVKDSNKELNTTNNSLN